MNVQATRNANDRDAGVVEEICQLLTKPSPQSFFLFAGAGSGKTRTLVEVLRILTGIVEHESGQELARALRLFGRSIRVITYTKNAVAVINGRLGNNDLVNVSTIHAFCWELISGYNDDIRDALISLKSKKLEEDKLESAAKAKGTSKTDLARHEEMMTDIESYRSTTIFRYHPDRNTYGSGALQHTQVLDVTAWLLLSRPALQKILRDRHPIILIDESQDTMKGILDSLIELSKPSERGLTLGLLGDHRQRIYMDGHADLPSQVPEDWAKPELQMNHRSQQRIVTLINKIWEAKLQGRTQKPTGVKQHHRSEKTGGTVRIFVGNASLSSEDKVIKEQWCAGQMVSHTSDSAWSTNGYQLLALEHKLVATRGSFLSVYTAMDLIDPNAAAPVGSGENKGPAAVRFLLEGLLLLTECADSDGKINEFLATEVLRQTGAIERLPDNIEMRRVRSAETLDAISKCIAATKNKDATVAEVLAPILELNLFEVDSRLSDAFDDKSPPPPPPVPRKEKETIEARMRRGWCRLFSSPWGELKRYKRYLNGESELATHQVVKGSEFKHVMVVMDDSDAGGFLISYDKLFGAKELSAADKSNVESGKETTVDRSLRLLYVTCSRAQESLALVLWAVDPIGAIASIKGSKWFSENEIELIS
jgi:DNA helicase-2/ATP-dependent DNA helicase PcrA